MTRRSVIMVGILLLRAPLSCAQTTPAAPQFQVVSIEAANPSAPHPGRLGAVPVVTSSGRLTARHAKVTELIKGAYTVEDYQVSGGPGVDRLSQIRC
jgi:hypothetical protein